MTFYLQNNKSSKIGIMTPAVQRRAQRPEGQFRSCDGIQMGYGFVNALQSGFLHRLDGFPQFIYESEFFLGVYVRRVVVRLSDSYLFDGGA